MEQTRLDDAPELEESETAAPIATASDNDDEDFLSLEDEAVEMGDGSVYREYLYGQAGTGKTYEIRRRIEESPRPNSYLLCATTAIAAVNLGADVSTLHSTLGFYNYDSLQDRYLSGGLQRKFAELAKGGVRYLAVDEASMLSSAALDLLDMAAEEAAGLTTNADPVGIILAGDMAQLGPIPDHDPYTKKAIAGTEKYAFESDHWRGYGANATKLTKVWRQDSPEFLEALNAARVGKGHLAVDKLLACGVEFDRESHLDDGFEGTTIYSTNAEVDRYNNLRLSRLTTPMWRLRNRVFGTDEVLNHPPSDWGGKKRTLIPETFEIKQDALVMILLNERNEFRSFDYVNGDVGLVKEYVPAAKPADGEECGTLPVGGSPFSYFTIEIQRRDYKKLVKVKQALRPLLWKHPPERFKDVPKKEWPRWSEADGPLEQLIPRWREGKFEPLYVTKKQRWLHGAALWWPMRLAWASTVHKTQGQTLEKVQIDPRGKFWENPSSCYVALSRCRQPEGVRIIGAPDLLARRIKTDPRVKEWL